MQNKNVVGLLGMAGFVVMADNWVVSPILPAIAAELNIDVSDAGLLITAYMIPFGLFQLVFGPLADRFGKRQVITGSMILFTLAAGLCALGMGLNDLALYRALTGVFAAAVMPISVALLGDLFSMKERQGAIGTFIGISFLGQGLSMAIGGAIAFFLDWRGVFALYALLAVIPTAALMKRYTSLPSNKNPEAKFIAPYLKLISNAKAAGVYFLIVIEGFLIVGGFSYLGAYISQTHGFNYLQIGLIMTAFGLATVLGGRLSGKLVAGLGQKKLLMLGLLLAGLADLALAQYGHHLAALITCVALLGLGFIFAHSVLVTRSTEFNPKARGAAMSLVAFCFMGAGGAGTALGGLVISQLGFAYLYSACGLALLGALLASFALFAKGVEDSSGQPASAGMRTNLEG